MVQQSTHRIRTREHLLRHSRHSLGKSPIHLGSVFLSRGCCNKLAQTLWLKTIQLIILQLWRSQSEVVSLGRNQGVGRAHSGGSGGEALGENPFPYLFQRLVAACVLGLRPLLPSSKPAGASFFKSFSDSDPLLPPPHFFLLTFIFLPLSYRDAADKVGATW